MEETRGGYPERWGPRKVRDGLDDVARVWTLGEGEGKVGGPKGRGF